MSRRNADGGAAATTAAVFGELLKHYREAEGLTQEGLARRIPCDRSHVARVEAGARVPQDTFAKACDELLGTGGVLVRLWCRIDWYPVVQHPDWFERRADMDARAVALREYQERVIPGLLQTPGYAHALFSQVASGDEVEERVRARLSRQPRFLADDGPLYVAVLDESCLHNAVGSPEVMRDQCAHLLNVGQRLNIRIQVAPAGLYGLVRPRGSMSLIRLPGGHEWMYSESLDRGHFNDDPAAFARYSQTYDVLRADAPSARESAALISDVMEGYEHDGQSRTRRGDLDQEQLQRQQRRQLRGNRPRFPRRRPRP
ncbi:MULTISPECIES: helix-turn-helix transcriptional regulator [unclassified Streptomyces]|uniref:helix-turn-helix domain-containing protein n=1 Tax=unclassified Streptomyces TaxID=2593676 RepID=UPI002E811174|nr:helix-turn-helix transcriptional regulator [Streptomyces sp. NBC_00589]WTI37140.1 helix-turn-helix domain-containing protein [Streptomyces sp. NBC_00775]WUB29184.1 helix-turn-helix domain-containing protein [Streptomyces sp. NBC_00589]